VPTPTPTPVPTPTPGAPPIPDIALFNSNLTTYGIAAGEALLRMPDTGDPSLAATYYDGERVFLGAYVYTGSTDARWLTYAAKAERIYRGYAERAGYNVPGYWNFTEGLLIDAQTTGDQASIAAVKGLASKGSYCVDGTEIASVVNAAYSREVSYCINAHLDAEKLGAARRAYTGQLVDISLGHIDQWWISKSFRLPSGSDVPAATGQYYVQPFMVGLTTQKLIKWFEATGDTRVLPAVKAALDGLWARTWVAADQSFFYENWAPNGTAAWTQPISGAPDLNLLIAPSYAWLAAQTGDTSYRDKADAIFAGGVRQGDPAGPKQFNQAHEYVWDYFRWRK
jgi:hypothetical protein